MNRLVEQWKQAGAFSIWRYIDTSRNYRGWHATGDRAGCESLVALLDAFLTDGVAGYRTVQLQVPTAAMLRVPNNRGADWFAPASVRINYSPDENRWELRESEARSILTLGRASISSLRTAVAAIPDGEGDYSVGPDDAGQRLWIWWFPGH